MKNEKKLLSLFLSIVLLLGLFVPALAAEEDGAVYSAVVQFEEGADAQMLCAELEALPGIRVRWRYHALFSGAAIEGTRSALALAGERTGVHMLAMSRVWTLAQPITDPLDPTNSLELMNALTLPYDGDGTVVAVIDSGLKISHEAFRDYGIMDDPVISRETIKQFVAEGGTNGRYHSEKIPFIYDYCEEDRLIHTADGHGTHVSALAVGYAEDGSGGVKFRGAAPAAQLLAMKVFPDDAKQGADDADILKAIEDAYLLGADVINLSLGIPSAFFGDDRIGLVYSAVLTRLQEAGVVVCSAVGNYSASVSGKSEDAALPSGGYTDYSTACAPAIYDGAVAIAAVNAAYYEAGGGLIVGERAIQYTDTISEVEGEILPNIMELSGQTMDYVVIDGLGTAEDFAGLDLTGCIAVVKRGEIMFSEKARNAAAAGAALCVIYNNEAGVILPAVTDITIPCVLITRSDGNYLIEQAKDGRGLMTIAPFKMRVSTGDSPAMLTYSSWGAAGMRFTPALSAPGGMILSASVSSDDAYEYMSGTSMATPNAAGVYALLLQALHERGIEDKKERAELATALLLSTTVPVRNENGVRLSPRRQGAGLIDLAAALDSDAVITDPLLELGESGDGRFTLRFTVKNLTDEPQSFTLRTTVLTDAYGAVDGSWKNLLEPLDITERVSISLIPPFRVEAHGERTITMHLNLDRDLLAELEHVYPNGFFTEGYVTLSGKTGKTLSAAFLGYCGDWEEAPILEQVDFRAVMDALFAQEAGEENALSAIPVDMGYNLALLCDDTLDTYEALFLGENPWLATPAEDARIAMPTEESNAFTNSGDRFLIDLYTLRDAEHVIMLVSDRTSGEVYYAADRAYLPRSKVSDTLGEALPATRFVWDGTGPDDNFLPNGTEVTVRFYAWLESEAEISRMYQSHECTGNDPESYRWLLTEPCQPYLEWEFPLVLDAAAPEVFCRINDAEESVTVTVTEEQFLAYAAVRGGGEGYLAEEAYADTQAGTAHTLTIPLEKMIGEKLYITAADYAGNAIGYEIDLSTCQPGETVSAVHCPAAMLKDILPDAWYHDAVDFVINNGLMEVQSGLRFAPDSAVTRAQAVQLLYDLAGRPAVTEKVELPFLDLRSGDPILPALKWAYSRGIVTGYDDSYLGAYAPLQRQQLAAMFYRAAAAAGEDTGISAAAEELFADETVAVWAADALVWAVEHGYLSTDEAGMIRPEANVVRAEFAYLLTMLYQGGTNDGIK